MAGDYVTATGEEGSDQLDNLDRWYGKESRKFLLDIGLKPGMRVLDVGCGIGNLSRWMAEIVGPTGSVTGVDNDEKQIVLASQRAKKNQIANCHFEQADASDLTKYQDQYDLVYCRWVLIHVKDAKQVTEQMANAVKTGGLLASETGDMFTSRYYPSFANFDLIVDKLNVLLPKTGANVHIAQDIFTICQALNNFDFNARYSQDVLYNPDTVNTYTHHFTHLLDGVGPAFEKFNLLSPDELKVIKTSFENYQAKPGTHIALSRMTQVWCKKLA